MALILQYPLGCPRSQIVEDVAHGFERPQVLIGNRNAELVLKRHIQLYRIQAVRLQDRKSTRLNSSHSGQSRMPSSA